MNTFSARLKRAMEARKITAAELSRKSGISKSSISEWLKGSYEAKQDKVYILAQTLNVDEGFLLGYDIEMVKKDDILAIYNKLTPPRQRRVYTFASDQLDEQNATVEEAPSYYTIVLSGAVSAGDGEYLQDEQQEEVTITSKPPRHDFAVKVNGRSMEPLFQDQEIIFVEKEKSPRIGQVVIASIDGEAYVKKLAEDRLISLNPAYDDIYLHEGEDVKIMGVVIL